MDSDTSKSFFTNLDACVSIVFIFASYNTILGNRQRKPRCEIPFSTERNEIKASALGLLCSFSPLTDCKVCRDVMKLTLKKQDKTDDCTKLHMEIR